jgi:colanic acid biosynthesis glycosyl transferase WcaI
MGRTLPRCKICISVIPSPINVELIRPVPRTGAFRARHAIPRDALVVMHAGSMGMKQGLLNVIAAARLTRDTKICWVLVGEGDALSDLIEATRRDDLGSHVWFVPFQPEEALAEMFADADVLLLNQLSAVQDTVIPSKLLTYMAAGRPVLAAVNPASQAARLLRKADGGVLVAPEDPNALAEAARWFTTAAPLVVAGFSQRNRRYAEQHFDQRNIIAAHEHFILDTLRVVPQRTKPGPTPGRR